MVYRVFVEKKPELANEAAALCRELRSFLGIETLRGVRIINRYDVGNIDEELFLSSCKNIFSEPQLDTFTFELNTDGYDFFAVEYLPGQFDQRADSAAQCIAISSRGAAPEVRTAKIYLLSGELSPEDMSKIIKYVINPVESHEASMELPETLRIPYTIPEHVEKLDGFRDIDGDALDRFISSRGLAMDCDDLRFCRDYFRGEKRDPTITEIKMIDTYWSDHCRHTTFLTTIDNATFDDAAAQNTFNEYLEIRRKLGRTKPVNLMDIATIAAKYLKKEGKLSKLDESEEINACTVKIKVKTEDGDEDWLLLFKNETHNHPTEIEPFGGAATCIGGAIRDPLSGRAYVYSAMRVTGAADPTRPVGDTIPGKLPQKKLVTTAAAGYSSYGNQIGLATGQVDEIYHDGYAAKRMEIGAVIGAVPAANVRREEPLPGDIVILLGGRTGRDGCGGATGSSKSHTSKSLETCGAEVQKGNAPEERKLQRLFRNARASSLIKRCNDFGAGGVSVAIGELADGLLINLNAVPKKYDGLDGTELAISESQERMAVVVSPDDADEFRRIADSENLEATIVARVTDNNRLTMTWNGQNIVDISREFLNSNGAEKHIDISVTAPAAKDRKIPGSFTDGFMSAASDLNICSKRGLAERFDSTIGAGTVLMPFGGKYQLTPSQAMVNKVSCETKHTDTVSYMAWGYNPYITECSPYRGAYLAVIESVSKLIASGADFTNVYLTFQEYFEKPGHNPERWGKPMAALLGALRAQLDLGIAAIGGKDSMSGSFEALDVPPTLVSFAVTTGDASMVLPNPFRRAGDRVVLLCPDKDGAGLPDSKSLIANWNYVHSLIKDKKVSAAWTPTYGGVAEGVMKMCMGNRLGFNFSADFPLGDIFGYNYGAFLLEVSPDEQINGALTVGYITDKAEITRGGEKVSLSALIDRYEGRLESVYPCNITQTLDTPEFSCYNVTNPRKCATVSAKPTVIIPVFPGTNCEYDSAKTFNDAGARVITPVINNLTADSIKHSVESFAKLAADAQMIFIPGGFSGGDEPDGSGKFITSFFRNAEIREQVAELLERRDGLIAGICNGFQALIKLGLVPYGKIIDTDEGCPTLTYNTIGRHQSRIVRTRVVSNKSPWLANAKPGEIYEVPISHGEGRLIAPDGFIEKLAQAGQVATQYVDADGRVTSDIRFNPNGSMCAVEGITSPDGRVLGKMGHSERWGTNLYRNVDGNYDIGMFRAAVAYFKVK